MNITFVVNENYAIYLYVAIKSILKNNKDSSIHFYVFNEYLSEISKSEILKLKKKYIFKIDFIEIISEIECKDFPIWKVYNSKLVNYRFLIADYMKRIGENKFLYLDADIICKKSLRNLYETNLANYAFGLVPSGYDKEERLFIPKLNLKKGHKYAYSGLLLVDVENYMKQKIKDNIIKIAHMRGDELHWPDMDLLNLVCDGNNYVELPPKYSINPGWQDHKDLKCFLQSYKNIFPPKIIKEAYFEPVIWQLAGGAKPNSQIALLKVLLYYYYYTIGSIYHKYSIKWLMTRYVNKFLKSILNIEKKYINDGYIITRIRLLGISLIKIRKPSQKLKLFINNDIKRLNLKPVSLLHDKPNEYIKQCICIDKNNRKYIVAYSDNKLTKWKILNSVSDSMLNALQKSYNRYYCFNKPIIKGLGKKGNAYAVYYFYDNLTINSYDNNNAYFNAIKAAQDVYNNAEEMCINIHNVDSFAWETLKNNILVNKEELETYPTYKVYKDKLLLAQNIKVAAQHCDYALENLMVMNNESIKKKIYMMDLERACACHIASYDWYHLERKKRGWDTPLFDNNIPYCDLCNSYCDVLTEWRNRFVLE